MTIKMTQYQIQIELSPHYGYYAQKEISELLVEEEGSFEIDKVKERFLEYKNESEALQDLNSAEWEEVKIQSKELFLELEECCSSFLQRKGYSIIELEESILLCVS